MEKKEYFTKEEKLKITKRERVIKTVQAGIMVLIIGIEFLKKEINYKNVILACIILAVMASMGYVLGKSEKKIMEGK